MDNRNSGKASAQPTTAERVKAVCDELYAAGTMPTVRQVLSKLPGISSTSTVYKPFSEWKLRIEQAQQSKLVKLGISEEFKTAFLREIERYSAESEKAHEERVIECMAQQMIAEEALAEAQELMTQQNATLEKQSIDLNALRTKSMDDERANAATVRELRQQLEEKQKALHASEEQTEMLRTEQARTSAQLETSGSILAEVRATSKMHHDENVRLRNESSDLAKQNARLESSLDGLQQLVTEFKSSAARYERSITTMTEEKSALVIDQARLRQQLDDARALTAESREKLADQQQTVLELRSTIAEQSSVIKRLTTPSEPLTAVTGPELPTKTD